MAVRGVYTEDEKKILAEAREWIGKSHYVGEEHRTYCYNVKNWVATRDLIKNYAIVIGDDNPLWFSEDYARSTKYGCIIAPPFFLHCIASGFGVATELNVPPHVGRIASINPGNKWQFFKPVYVNDSFRVKDTLLDIEDTTSLDGKEPRQFTIISERVYINQRDEVVCIIRRRMPENIIPPPPGGPPKDYKEIPLHLGAWPGTDLHWAKDWEFTKEELEAIDRTFREEERRGSNPRYWEDVSVGDTLRPVMHGPNTLHDQSLLYVTVGPILVTSRALRREYAGNPEMQANINYRLLQAHMGTSRATFLLQRDSMLGLLMTNWMGDDGFLKRFNVSIRMVDPTGDARWCRGKVIKKYVEDGEHLVDLAVWEESVRGWVTVTATATVVLPSRTIEGANHKGGAKW